MSVMSFFCSSAVKGRADDKLHVVTEFRFQEKKKHFSKTYPIHFIIEKRFIERE
jgi:hypothetical protein